MRQSDRAAENLAAMMSGTARGGNSFFHEPTDEERVARLQDSTQKGLCKGAAKKALLNRVTSLRKDLLKLANDDGKSDLHGNLSAIFDTRSIVRIS